MLHAEALSIMLNDHMPKDKASPCLQEAAPENDGFSMSRSSDRFLLYLTMLIFHFPMNRISFTKYLFFSFKSGRQIKIPLSITMLRIRQKPVYLLGLCCSASLLAICLCVLLVSQCTSTCCWADLPHAANSLCNFKLPHQQQVLLQNQELSLQSNRVRPYSAAVVQKKIHHTGPHTNRPPLNWAWEEGGSTVLLLSKHFTTFSNNQPATHRYILLWRNMKKITESRGQERELQIQTILVFFVLKIGSLFIDGLSSCTTCTQI